MTHKKAWDGPFALLSVVVAAFLLTGCPSLQRAAGVPNVDRAESLSRAGDHAAAAGMFERLANETTTNDRFDFLLRAAREYFAAGRPADADRILAQLPPGGLTQKQSFDQTLMRIQSALAQGRGDEAWKQVSSMQAPTAPDAAARYYETRQRVAVDTNHLVDGIRAELARERFIAPGETHAARSELLEQLRAAAERGTSFTPPPGSDATIRGWLEAGSIAGDNARNPTLGATRLLGFRTRYPSHPALAALSGEPSVGSETKPSQLESAAHIALMLPLTGRTASASAQIRDGFMTAYYEIPANARPRLRVYDTASGAIADLVGQATAAGAEFIVGPLTREEVVAAADLSGKRPPMLALNFLPSEHASPERFYQYALSPEDDARSVARALAASGKRHGVVLAPEGDWGTRVMAAFDEELRGAGGFVLGSATYNSAERDFDAVIMHVLRTDDSRARQQRIQSSIGQRLEFEPRRRPDIQFIFAPSPLPSTARMLRPKLRYHLANVGDIPTYMLGDAFDPHPTANQEIEGVAFPDMPWMLDHDGLSATVRDEAARAFGDANTRHGRLFAFGYDAFRVASSLQRGTPVNPQGLTGTLSIDNQGHVRRELEWVRIKDGAPIPLPPDAQTANQPQ
jgi:outer membrane PBP1 activator LpoA protein